MREVIAATLFLLPFLCGWILLFRLSVYRRDGAGSASTLLRFGMGVFRPDFYSDEGQPLLRWVWFLLVLTLPWCLGVAFLFG